MARADLLRLSLGSIRRPCWSACHGNRSPKRCSWPISYFGCCAGTRAQPAAQRDLLINHPRTPTRTGFCDGGDEFRVPASIPSRAALAVFVGDLIAGKGRTKETCPQASSFGRNRSERGSATANDLGALTRKDADRRCTRPALRAIVNEQRVACLTRGGRFRPEHDERARISTFGRSGLDAMPVEFGVRVHEWQVDDDVNGPISA